MMVMTELLSLGKELGQCGILQWKCIWDGDFMVAKRREHAQTHYWHSSTWTS